MRAVLRQPAEMDRLSADVSCGTRLAEDGSIRLILRFRPIRQAAYRKLSIMWPDALHLLLYVRPDSGQNLIHLMVEMGCILYTTHVLVEMTGLATARSHKLHPRAVR